MVRLPVGDTPRPSLTSITRYHITPSIHYVTHVPYRLLTFERDTPYILSHPEEHSKWEYTNWTNNLRNLRHAIEKDNKRMHDDMLSYGHDLAIVNALRAANPNQKPRWRGSEAAKRLKEDVDKGKHLEMKHSTLHQTRPEYLVFDLDVFRKHIYQEIDSRPKRAYCFEKKKKAWKYPELHKEHPDL